MVAPTFEELKASLPGLPSNYQSADTFDWALHPGGASILTGVEREMTLTSEHMRASYDTYINHGNSSSATIFSVLDRLRTKDMDALAPNGHAKDFVIGCAFGPGIAIEMCMLKRNMNHVMRGVPTGEATPPETESEGSRSDEETDMSLSDALNGVDLD